MKPELKKRQDKLEDILRKEAHISWGDRLRNIGYNLRENAVNFIPFGIALGVGGLIAWDIYALINHQELTSNYEDAYNFVSSLHGTVESAVEHGNQIPVSPEIIELPKALIEQGSQQIYTEQAKELLKGISQNEALFSKGTSSKSLLEYLGTLKDGLKGLADSAKEGLLGSVALVGILDAFGLFFTGAHCWKNTSWRSQLDEKRRLKRQLKTSLPELREKFADNPNAEQLYDFLDLIAETGISGSKLFEAASVVADYSDEKYRSVFEAIALHPKKHRISTEIRSAFREFDKQFKKEKDAQDKTTISPADGEGSTKLFKPVKYSEIYLSLLGSGWSGNRISSKIEKVEKTGKARGFFFNALSTAGHKETLFSNVLEFYEAFGKMDEDKRLAIAKYTFQKGNRQFSGRLKYCRFDDEVFDDEVIMEYISGLDKVPSVGVKGQVRTLMNLNNLSKHLETLEQTDKFDRLKKLVSYKPPKFDESALEVSQFLSRHPNVSFDEVFGGLAEYYQLTEGDKYTSSWLKKEVSKIKPAEAGSPEGLLDKKGERKFIEELKRKVDLARFEVFNRTIDDLYFAPLDDMLGERVDRTGIEITDELINVISGYHKTAYQHELQPLVKGIVKHHLENPDSSAAYISSLEGNQRLEEMLGQTLHLWRKGHTSYHDVGLDENIKQKIQDQIKREYADFTSCIVGLGYELPKVEGVIQKPKDVKEAEGVFKEVSKLDVPEEKQYLVVEAKHHLSNLKQKFGVVKKGYGKITFYDSKDPIATMQMGVLSGSCTNVVNGSNSFAAFVNALDDNKKVVYMVDEEGDNIGRTLAVLTDEGIIPYRKYENTNLSTDEAWVNHFHAYAQKVSVPLIVPTRFTTDGLKKALKSRGAVKKTVSTVLQKAVCSNWYDDEGAGRVEINEKGHNIKLSAYVLN